MKLSEEDLKTLNHAAALHLAIERGIMLCKMEAKLVAAERALQWYANYNSWDATTVQGMPRLAEQSDVELTDPHEDIYCRRGGKRAREYFRNEGAK